MRLALIGLILALPLAAQSNSNQKPPDCNGLTAEFDSRCACVLHPNGQLCKITRAMSKPMVDLTGAGLKPGAAGSSAASPGGTVVIPQTPVGPSAARTVALNHKDYLRFIHPDSRTALGLDLAKLMSLAPPELAGTLLGGQEMNAQIAAAMKEIDQFLISLAGPNDVLLLLTGKFEGGATTGMFLGHGVSPVMLGGPMRC